MDADIAQAIKIIDAKIASLRDARNRLAVAFGIDDESASYPLATQALKPPVFARNGKSSLRSMDADSSPTTGGRKVELAAFLKENGPMSRVLIVEKSGIPEGTVSYCLSDKRFFEQQSNSDWYITDFSKRGLQQRETTGNFQGGQH